MSCWVLIFIAFVLGEVAGLILMALIKERTTCRPVFERQRIAPYHMDEPFVGYQPEVDPDREPLDIPAFLRRQAE